MSAIMTKRGGADNVVTYEFVCDSTEDLQAIDSKYVTMGSVAIIIQGTTGFEVYMANGERKWINLGTVSSNGGNSNPEESNIVGQGTADHMIIHDDEGSNSQEENNSNENDHIIQGFPVYTIIGAYTDSFARLTLDELTISGDLLMPGSTCMAAFNTKSTILVQQNNPGIHLCYRLGMSSEYKTQYSMTSDDWFSDGTIYSLTDTTVLVQLAPEISGSVLKNIAFIDLSSDDITNINELYAELDGATDEHTGEVYDQVGAIYDSKIIEEYDVTNINYLTQEAWDAKYGNS